MGRDPLRFVPPHPSRCDCRACQRVRDAVHAPVRPATPEDGMAVATPEDGLRRMTREGGHG